MHQACDLLVAGGGLSGLSARRIEMRLTNGCGGGAIMNSKTSEELASLMDFKPFTIEEQRWFNQANGSRW